MSQQSQILRAYTDPVIFADDRVFRTLLQKQAKYIPFALPNFENDNTIRPEMRREVATWMLEVCEHHQALQTHGPNCPPEVFCLAMNYVDRFLGICSTIARSQLQLLGAVCLMVAWKVREHEPLPAQKLVEYSDNTLTLDDIMEWEVLLLSKLEWDVCSIIAFDFVEHIIQRLTSSGNNLSLPMESVRSSSETLITMCSGYHDFTNTSPCLIASACVYSTLRTSSVEASSSSNMSFGSDTVQDTVQMIADITSLSQDEIEKCSDDVDAMVRQSLLQQQSEGDNLLLSPSAVTSTPRRLRDSNHR